MSGSSAPHYGIALLQTLHALGSVETHLVLSDGARRTIQLEADLDPELVCRLADVVQHPNNLAASISSGSFLFDGPLAGAHLPLHVRSELCGRLPGELLHRRGVRQSDPAPEGSGRVVHRGLGAPIEKLLGYRERMGWGFTWAFSYQSDFNSNLAFSSGLDQMRKAIEPILDDLPPVAFRNARKAGTDIYGYMTELFGFTTFALEDGTVHQTYSTTGRGVEFLMPYYGSSTVLRTAAMRARAGNCGSAATTSTAASDWGRPYAPLAPRHTGRTNPDGQGWATENSFGWQLGAHVPRWLAAVRPCPRNVRASVPSCRNGFRSHLALAAWRNKGRQPTSPSRAQLAGCNTTSAGDP
jgi:hypothetical protein